MKIKSISLIALFLVMNLILASCGGSLPYQMKLPAAIVAQDSMEEPASVEESITATTTTDEPVATEGQSSATSEPSSTEELASATSELTSTEELVVTEELILSETPEIIDQPTPTEEPIETEEPLPVEEPTETEEPADAENSLSIEPAEGFWAISSYDGQMVTVVPKDWLRPDEFVFFELNAESFTTPGEQISLQFYASPDKKAYVCYLIYSDEAITNWNQALAQERALRILNGLYTNNARDIKVIAVQPMLDGSERLTWSSDACDCTGVIA